MGSGDENGLGGNSIRQFSNWNKSNWSEMIIIGFMLMETSISMETKLKSYQSEFIPVSCNQGLRFYCNEALNNK